MRTDEMIIDDVLERAYITRKLERLSGYTVHRAGWDLLIDAVENLEPRTPLESLWCKMGATALQLAEVASLSDQRAGDMVGIWARRTPPRYRGYIDSIRGIQSGA